MTQTQTDLWTTRSLPILRKLADLDENGGQVSLPAWAEELGCTAAQVANEIERLGKADFVDAKFARAGNSANPLVRVTSTQVLESGLRELALWPSSDPYDALMAVIDARLADLPDASEEKSKLKALRATLSEVGKSTATGVLIALAKHAGGF